MRISVVMELKWKLLKSVICKSGRYQTIHLDFAQRHSYKLSMESMVQCSSERNKIHCIHGASTRALAVSSQARARLQKTSVAIIMAF